MLATSILLILWTMSPSCTLCPSHLSSLPILASYRKKPPSLGKPVLVMREVTERPEAVEAGTSKLVGTDMEKIVMETEHLLTDYRSYLKMSRAHNPYGDGKASDRIVEILKEFEVRR